MKSFDNHRSCKVSTTMSQAPRILLAAALILAPLAVAAQQGPTKPQEPQAAPSPAPEPGPQVTPPPRPVAPSETPAGQSQTQSLVGLVVFSSDGTRVGEVRSVSTGPAGDIVSLHVRTGGFLGFGGRIVAIPQGKFIRSGQSIRLDFDSDEVKRLPEVRD